MSTQTEPNAVGDVLKWVTHNNFCLESRVIEGLGVGSGIAHSVGDVMRLGTGQKLITVSAATGASAIAVLLEPLIAAENDADINKLCLVRGPALIDDDKLVFSESDTQAAQAKAALAVLLMRDFGESATWTTQTT